MTLTRTSRAERAIGILKDAARRLLLDAGLLVGMVGLRHHARGGAEQASRPRSTSAL